MSYREQLIAIISMAQHASPNVTGQMDDRRAHWTIFSTVVVNTGISDSSPMIDEHQQQVSNCQQSAVCNLQSAI
jgi:hypothetical protein